MKRIACLSLPVSAVLTAFAGNVAESSPQVDSGSSATLMQARVSGNNLYIAYNDGEGQEVCYWFKPTMANELYTFHRVGFRQATSPYPSVNGIESEQGITWLNVTSSDNIGPVSISSEWIGGNHTIDGYKTAATQSVKILADGKIINENSGNVACQSVTVQVNNLIFDPLSAKTKNGTFSETMITEVVTYTVERNAIDVVLTHTYHNKDTRRIATYYGMQSMFYREDFVMTPHGPYTSFTPQDQVQAFKYTQYPAFDRFIEMKSDIGWCQAAHMHPDGIGDHHLLSTSSNSFIRSSNKCYHILIKGFNVTNGSTYTWHGTYSWFKPLLNDDNALIYRSMLNGKEVVYVDAKRACNFSFDLPWQNGGTIVDCDNGINIETNGTNSLNIRATAPGTAILGEHKVAQAPPAKSPSKNKSSKKRRTRSKSRVKQKLK